MIYKRHKEPEDKIWDQFKRCGEWFERETYYEYKWQELKFRYKKINLYELEFQAIGETMPRVVNAIQDMRRNPNAEELNVFLLTANSDYTGGVFNVKLLEIFRRYLYIIDDTNYGFWSYVFKNYRADINTNNFKKYYLERAGYIPIETGVSFFEFTEDEVQEGTVKSELCGINREYVCVHARGRGNKRDNYKTDYRDKETSIYTCNINEMKRACEYLSEQGMQLVKVGKFDGMQSNISELIDYSHEFSAERYDDLMDFYFISKCKFVFGSASGLTYMAGFFGSPVLVVNTFILVYGAESMPYTGHDMLVLQKFWSQQERRYLNLYEMMNVANRCDIYKSNYDRNGIKLIKNTEKEIYEAVAEMNQKLDGKWIESEEEKEAVKKYFEIINTWEKRHTNVIMRKKLGCNEYQMLKWRICWSYLKNNLYLLDVNL